MARMRDRTGACRVLVGKPGGKKPLRRSSCTWDDNSKGDL